MQMRAEVKPALWGAVGGAVVLAIIGFGWGGWMTASSARDMVKKNSDGAVVAAIIVQLFREFGPAVRACLVLLIAFQVVWGADAYFFPTHAMATSPPKRVIDLIASGYAKNYEGRFDVQTSYQKIGEDLPADARVLFHEHHPHLGVGRESVLDSYQWQYAIDYGAEGSPEAGTTT